MLCVLVRYLQTCSRSSVLSLGKRGKKGEEGGERGNRGRRGKQQQQTKEPSKARAYTHALRVPQTAAIACVTAALQVQCVSNFPSSSLRLLRCGRAPLPLSHPLHPIFSGGDDRAEAYLHFSQRALSKGLSAGSPSVGPNPQYNSSTERSRGAAATPPLQQGTIWRWGRYREGLCQRQAAVPRSPAEWGLLRSQGAMREGKIETATQARRSPLSSVSRGRAPEVGSEEKVTETERCKHINNVSLGGGKGKLGAAAPSSFHSASLRLYPVIG